MDVTEASAQCDRVLDEIGSAVIADREFLETVLLGFVGRGHVLMEDVPGTGKTLTARSMARALGLDFSRVQFTPDLLPADITGTHVFNERERSFEFNEGPLFANVVLADEINRAPPKTQSALLEAMEEEQVTVDGDTYDLPTPFFVLATQNPVEMEGTFELPEAQVDRFLLKILLDYPSFEEERDIVSLYTGDVANPSVERVVSRTEIQQMQSLVRQVPIADDVRDRAIRLVQATRDREEIEFGASPRASMALVLTAKARAFMRGRRHVSWEDVVEMAPPVLRHRILLDFRAEREGLTPDEVIDRLLESAS